VIQKKLENVEYFNSVASIITNDSRCSRAIKPRIVIAKSAFNKKILFTSIGLEFKGKSEHSFVWG